MKKTILIVYLLFPFLNYAQTFQSYYNASSSGGGFSYNATVIITPLQYNSALKTQGYKVKLVSATPDIKGYYDLSSGKYFTCAEIGSICKPNSFLKANVELFYQCNNSGTQGVMFSALNEERVVSFRLDPDSKCNVSVQGVYFVTDHDYYRSRILELKFPKQNNSNSKVNSSDTGKNSNLPNSETNTTTQPVNNYDPNTRTYTNPLDYSTTPSNSSDKFSNDVQNVTTIINTAAPLLEEWKINRQKRYAEEERRKTELENQKAELAKLSQQKAEEYFKNKYLDKYLKSAIAGDEQARMTLMFKASTVSAACSRTPDGDYVPCDVYKLLPQNNWLEEAVSNNNRDAMNRKAGYITAENEKEQIQLLEKAAGLGSLDAMIQLGDFYDKIPDKKYKEIYGGANAEKAFYWYSKAAEVGCPKGMYYLGMIYKYGYSRQFGQGVSPKGHFVQYKIEKDNKKAAQWFTKSIMVKNHAETLYAKDKRESLVVSNLESKWISASIFDYEAYRELSLMYEKGIGVEKNIEISKELYSGYKDYRKLYNLSEE